MQVSSLHLTNFRLFEDLEITFPDSNVAVIIGSNGSGKSSIMDAIAYLLSKELERAVKDLNKFPKTFPIKLLPNKEQLLLFDLGENIIKHGYHESIMSAEYEIPHRAESTLIIGHGEVDYRAGGFFWEILLDLEKKEIKEEIPIFLYYQSEIGEEIKIDTSDWAKGYQLEAWRFSLNGARNLGFKAFFQWFRNEEDWENEQQRQRRDFDFVNPILEVVRNAIEPFFSKLSKATFSDLRVVRKRANGNGVTAVNESSLVITKEGEHLQINQLSSGEKRALMMVVDIARRLSLANPKMKNPLLGTGIVMIDEIELHLHPQWQRNILPALNHTFPNIQFIVTTHSPQVLSNVDRESVLILEDGKMVKKTPPTRGRDSNSILYDLMNVKMRPDDFAEKLDALYELIDDERLEEAKTKLAELQATWGDEDSEIVRAKTMLELFTD